MKNNRTIKDIFKYTMKTYGRELEDDKEEDRFLYHQELYTIAYEMEQLNRMGKIYYNKDKII